MQKYFSTAEIVSFQSSSDYPYNVFETNKMVSYVVLYNIVTCQQPRLKHIEVYGAPDAVVDILTNVVKLCTECDQSPVCFSLEYRFQVSASQASSDSVHIEEFVCLADLFKFNSQDI